MSKDQIRQKIPPGIKLIIFFRGLVVFVSLFDLILGSIRYWIGPFMLTGTIAEIMHLIFIIIDVVILYGLTKRYELMRKMTIGLGIYNMALVMSKWVYFFIKPESISIPSVCALLFVWIIDLTIINYLIKRKDFFTR